MAATTPRYRPLGALVLLSLLLTLTLLTPPSHAVTSAARDDSESSLSVRVVINQDDTYDMTVIGQLKSKSSSDKRGMKENCNPSDAGGPFEDLKASYSERNGLPPAPSPASRSASPRLTDSSSTRTTSTPSTLTRDNFPPLPHTALTTSSPRHSLARSRMQTAARSAGTR